MLTKLQGFEKSKQFIGVQYLRGIAVLFVVLDHVTSMSKLPKYFGSSFNIFNSWFECGAVGVDLFFVISGFIIFYVSLKENDLSPKTNSTEFLKLRFLRIIPFLWVCIAGTMALRLVGRSGDFPYMSYLRSITLFPIGDVEPRPIWTLRHEFLFYILFCLFIVKYKFNNKWLFIIVWFLSPCIWFGLGFNKMVSTPWLHDLLSFVFNYHNITFGLGFFIGYIYKKGYLNYQWKVQQGFLLSIIISIPLLIAAHATGMTYASNNFEQVIICGIISFVLVIIGIILSDIQPLNIVNRLGLLLGNASYAIYLVHSTLLSATIGIFSSHMRGINPVLFLFISTIISLCGGIIAHFLIEKPLIKFLKRRFDVKKTTKILVSDQPASFR